MNDFSHSKSKYFIFIDNKQIGPLELEDLKNYEIKTSTKIWREGEAEWKEAKDYEELKDFIKIIPPPLKETEKKQNSKSAVNKLVFLNLAILSIIISIYVTSSWCSMRDAFDINNFGIGFHNRFLDGFRHGFIDKMTNFDFRETEDSGTYFLFFMLMPFLSAIASSIFLNIRKIKLAKIFMFISLAFCFPVPVGIFGLLGTMRTIKLIKRE
ncbi:MAG: GYF domain-containing protein [Bacteroidales bacterium]|jgi:hypothetical protein|nr:GYF domain-containing protein [Bacteroidales bacterium]